MDANEAQIHDQIDRLIDDVTELAIKAVESGGGMTEQNAMEALAITIGGWIAVKHRHYFPSQRTVTAMQFGNLIRASMENAWEKLHKQHQENGEQ